MEPDLVMILICIAVGQEGGSGGAETDGWVGNLEIGRKRVLKFGNLVVQWLV